MKRSQLKILSFGIGVTAVTLVILNLNRLKTEDSQDTNTAIDSIREARNSHIPRLSNSTSKNPNRFKTELHQLPSAKYKILLENFKQVPVGEGYFNQLRDAIHAMIENNPIQAMNDIVANSAKIPYIFNVEECYAYAAVTILKRCNGNLNDFFENWDPLVQNLKLRDHELVSPYTSVTRELIKEHPREIIFEVADKIPDTGLRGQFYSDREIIYDLLNTPDQSSASWCLDELTTRAGEKNSGKVATVVAEAVMNSFHRDHMIEETFQNYLSMKNPPNYYDIYIENLFTRGIKKYPNKFLQMLDKIPNSKPKDQIIFDNLNTLITYDKATAAEWAGTLTDPKKRKIALLRTGAVGN
jgi:hypothetical protein